MTTADRVAFLSDPASYPEPTTRIDRIETHMAFVFLTDAFAYKMKKPVRYDFLDFSTCELRRHMCEEEVRLNRRLAPDVYIGTVPLVRVARDRLHLGRKESGDTIDWLVKMKRLPHDRMLDEVIRQGGPTARELESVASLLVRFQQAAPVEPIPPDAYVARLEGDIRMDVSELAERADHLPYDLIDEVGTALRRALDRSRALFRARAEQERIRELHGDLRPEHVCLIDPPVVIDCIEFRREFRLLDPADELAFLGMECERLGAPQVGSTLLHAYQTATGDRLPPGLVEFYTAMRAVLRAKLAIWHLRNGEPSAAQRWSAVAHDYLVTAAQHVGVRVRASAAER